MQYGSISSLCGDGALECLECRAVRECFFGACTAFLPRTAFCKMQHSSGERERYFAQIIGAFSTQDEGSLTYLEAVADGTPERCFHVGQQGSRWEL